MSVKASVSIAEQQDDFARRLVADGHFSSLSAVVQRGLDYCDPKLSVKRSNLLRFALFFEERAAGSWKG